jgi:O-antigen ligase
LWEPRWYTGFTVVSYPPLTHQLIGLLVPLFGFDAAYAIILWAITSLYPLGVYAFCRVFVGRTAASYAALASAILLPIFVTAHIFGQLPFLFGTLISLFGAASLDRYLREGSLHNLVLTVALVTTTMASHHATVLLQPFLILAILIHRWSNTRTQTKELCLSVSPWFVMALRFFLYCFLAIISSMVVIWPFWQWGMDQTIQTPIDHLSRHNFFTDPYAAAVFFWPLYGPLVLMIPVMFRKWPPRFGGLRFSLLLLFLLGLGGTTPLPRLFFGDAWEWLTYDRFAFWASLFLTPFFGILFIRIMRKWKDRVTLRARTGSVTLRRSFLTASTFSVFALTALAAWLSPILFPIQPGRVDMQPIIDFLARDGHSQWRYLTLGFGDQFARLNLLTEATTIDGSYHTARTLPELRESGIGQIDTVYWNTRSLPALDPILQKAGAHGVRWGFVNIPQYVPVLQANGWKKISTFEGGVQVWENPSAQVPAASQPPRENPLASFSWGTLPMLALLGTVSLASLRLYPARAEQILRTTHAVLVGLIPVGLCFWYFRTVGDFPHPGVYFIYSNALFFPGDAFASLAVVLWAATRIGQGPTVNGQARFSRSTFHPSTRLRASFLLLTFILLTSLSILWSTDWRTSLYVSLHLWLIFFLILSLRDWSGSWKAALLGLGAALIVQIVAGSIGFAAQSTAFLAPMKTVWPGPLEPSLRGASVVELPSGERILRAYGTLPHPNILGGFVVSGLLAPVGFFLTNRRTSYVPLLLLFPGVAVLALSFSRAAWLALIGIGLVLLWKSKYFDRKRLAILLAVVVLSLGLTLFPFRELVAARTVNTTSHAEEFSFIGRAWLNGQAIQMLRERPLTGVGVGTFILQLAQRAGEGYVIEPAHNIFLLAGAELGLPGMILLTALALLFAYYLSKAQNPNVILAGATLTGLGVISMFDHYLWTLPPCRLLLGLMLGLWAGQLNHAEA